MAGGGEEAGEMGEDGIASGEGAKTTVGSVDVLIVSLGSTGGLRRADEELAGSLRRAGASVAVVVAAPPRPVRTLALTDLTWALAARHAARAELARCSPRTVIYSSTTAALFWPRPGAIRFDAPSAGNRPGRAGLWQRPLERLRLGRAPLLLPWSESGLREAPEAAVGGERTLVLPVPVEPSRPSGPPVQARDIAAVTYGANPAKKGLDRVLAAWRAVRRSGEELVVMGASASDPSAGSLVPTEEGVRTVGMLPYEEYRALLRRARVFVCAPRREDYGIAQLEALADGCELVSTSAPGPYAALPIARELDGRLVGGDLASALRTALDDPAPSYSARALDALVPFRREAVDRLVAERLLPCLLA
jgi:glycosyltransferase involved in cell wall biosynthesis